MTSSSDGSGLSSLDLLDRYARELQRVSDPLDLLGRGLTAIVDLVPGCDHAATTMIISAAPGTGVGSSEVAVRCAMSQHDLDEGPALQAAAGDEPAVSHDLGAERRWSVWARTVAEREGIRSVLSLPLRVYRHDPTQPTAPVGAVNLFAHQPFAFDADTVALGVALTTQLAIAFGGAQEIEGRGIALGTRSQIGQAVGILMQRYGIGAEPAFDVLIRISQTSNTKLSAVARQLIDTGDLPQLHA